MYELVRVGNDKLIGEIIRLENDSATIQGSYSDHKHFASPVNRPNLNQFHPFLRNRSL